MKGFVSGMIAVVLLASCGREHKTVICGDYDVVISAMSDGERMDVTINESPVVMELVVSASGARFEGMLNDDKITLWNKADAWTMFINDNEAIACE